MVLVEKHEYYDAYRQLQQLSFRAGVLVFASTRDADAVCAVKILTSLLKLDSVPFSVVPVTDFEHLQAQAKAHLEAPEGDDPEPRAILMIGCGATESTSDVRPRCPSPAHADRSPNHALRRDGTGGVAAAVAYTASQRPCARHPVRAGFEREFHMEGVLPVCPFPAWGMPSRRAWRVRCM
jgi:hypothetical protein